MSTIQKSTIPQTVLEAAKSMRSGAEAAFESFLGKWDMPIGPRVASVWSKDDTLTFLFQEDDGRKTSQQFKYIDPATRFDPSRENVYTFSPDRRRKFAYDMEFKDGYPKFTEIAFERSGRNKTGPFDYRVAIVTTLSRDKDEAVVERRYQSIPDTFKFFGDVRDIVRIRKMLSEQPDHSHRFIRPVRVAPPSFTF